MSPRRAAVLCLTLAAQGLPTRGQLGEEWAAVAAHMQRLAKLPEGTGGLLSLAAAGLAARLKVWAPLVRAEVVPMRSLGLMPRRP